MKKLITLLMSVSLCALLLCACGKNEINVNPDAESGKHPISEGNQNPSPTDRPKLTEPAQNGTELTEKNDGQDLNPTAHPEENAEPAVTEEPTGEPVEEITATDVPEENEGAAVVSDDGRAEYWDITYLTWLPKFEAGSFERHYAADTFDYIVFSGVSRDDASAYVEALKKSGFVNGEKLSEKNGGLEFEAFNSKEWMAQVSFDGSTMTIGSGFIDEEEEDGETDGRAAAFSSSLLAYVPFASMGTFSTVEHVSDEGQWDFAVFYDVTEDEAREYAKALKNAGYSYGVDEGDGDGVIWYMGTSEENLNCDFQYYDGVMRIGCGYYEDD